MKVECENCSKSFELPDDRLPAGKKISFPCPACKSKITLDLRVQSEPVQEQKPEEPTPVAAPPPADKGEKVVSPRLPKKIPANWTEPI